MWRAGLSVVVGIATCLSFAAPAQAGGGGTVSITRTNGTVLIRPVDFQSGRALGPWRSATKDVLVGTYLMRTGRGSWAHVSLPFGIRQRGRWRYLPGGCRHPGPAGEALAVGWQAYGAVAQPDGMGNQLATSRTAVLLRGNR